MRRSRPRSYSPGISRHYCEREKREPPPRRTNCRTGCPLILTALTTTRQCWRATSAFWSKGVEKNNVEEYCVSEGWICMTAGNAKDRYGNPLTIKAHGTVEPYFRDQPKS